MQDDRITKVATESPDLAAAMGAHMAGQDSLVCTAAIAILAASIHAETGMREKEFIATFLTFFRMAAKCRHDAAGSPRVQ